MKVLRFEPADAIFERSPGQDADIFAANLADQRQGGPVTVGYGKYGPDQVMETNIVVDDVMVVLEGRVSVEANGETLTAVPGEIIYMPKGNAVVIRSHSEGALTAYVTYPHWAEAE
ncbi:AraC family ligand binding domain-containing protein [Pseudorhizobium flavum]|uniref:Ethanolamine utilization protein EutQ (Cupin superfamily) n=1 Tax=Pseudorhizobium flavum TaxID=1335061 RepID=A0A7X0DF77_9HYPH|nr:AraC family ligand binding domain-containing protein [Pseudorhizobium flavum]MBB6180859.1 ethanolamine utilization protein EutQ (cupin superfamily) [Pseudorhizobium flavum]CAD6602314.1 ethanolamine utilization protein [Pseudorhizobium flavum]